MSYRVSLVLAAGLLVSAGCDRGSTSAPGGGDASAVLAEFARFHQPVQRWSVTSQVEMRLRDAAGTALAGFDPMNQTRTIQVDGSKFAIHSEDGFFAASDGEYYFIANAQSARFHRGSPAPPQPSNLAQTPVASVFGGPENLRILRLSEGDPTTVIQGAGETVEYIGRETLDGAAAHHLRVAVPAGDRSSLTTSATTDVWIAAEGNPVLLQTVRSTPPHPLQFPGGQTVEAGTLETQRYENWHFEPQFSADSFRPPAEPHFRRVSSLPAVFEEPARLLGQTAPDVSLTPIEGESQRLSALEGKIVLLDFWASWCSPCREELPLLVKLEQEYADRGVVLYAVNLGESLGEIQGVLRRELADVKAVLDPDGAIAGQYDVGGIPHLAIIGPDGRVQAVHIGLSSDAETELREEIEALLSGADLASDGLPD